MSITMTTTSSTSTSSISSSVRQGSAISPPSRARFGPVSPRVQDRVQWIEADGGCEPLRPATTRQRQQSEDQPVVDFASHDLHAAVAGAAPTSSSRWLPEEGVLDALINTMAIKNAVRLQSLGYRPGVMGGHVGLLEGLRTRDMDKYDQATKPQKRRAPPTDLSGFTAEEIVARRNRLARQYSLMARKRRAEANAMLEQEVVAVRFTRDAIEHAPGIAYLMLSGDMRGLVLYANQGAEKVAGAAPAELLGRPFLELVHPDDRPALYGRLAMLVLSKTPHYRSSLRLQVSGGDLVDALFRFGALGVACSLWVVER